MSTSYEKQKNELIEANEKLTKRLVAKDEDIETHNRRYVCKYAQCSYHYFETKN